MTPPPRRTATEVERPEGLAYVPDLLTGDEELALVAIFEDMEFFEVRMRGQAARRTTRHFGYRYDYEGWTVVPTEPLPSSLEWLRRRSAALAELPPDAFAETLVTRYPPGAGIGWHRDAPMFGPTVVGVSLLSPCRLRLRPSARQPGHVHEVELAPRSAYVLGGKARSSWQHSIPPVKERRYSFTFRTLRGATAARSTAGGAVPDSSGQER